MSHRSRLPQYAFPEPSLFPKAPDSRLRRCFQTLRDGRIPLTDDWTLLLAALSEYRHTYVQVEHLYGRMSVKMDRAHYVDSLTGVPANPCLSMSHEYENWCTAWAKLEVCDCCGSPGNIQVLNGYGARFLQISPEHGTEPKDWARLLSGLAVQPTAENAPHISPVGPGYRILPEEALELPLNRFGFIQFLRNLSQMEESFEFCLSTAEAAIHSSFCLDSVYEEGGYLTGRGEGAGFVVSMKGVRGFAEIQGDSVRPSLLVVGPGESVLFEIRPVLGSQGAKVWAGVLEGVLAD